MQTKMLNQLHLGAKVFNGCGKQGQGMAVSRRDISRRANVTGSWLYLSPLLDTMVMGE